MKTIEKYSDDIKQAIIDLPYSEIINDNGIFIPECDYGFAEIYRLYNDILLFFIPTYGGTPSFYKCYGLHSIDSLIKDLKDNS